MIKKLFLVLTSLLFIAPAYSDDASSRKAAEELLTVTQADKMIDAVYSQMDVMFANMAKNMGITEAQKPIAEKYMKRITQLMREELVWDKLKTQMVGAYVAVYTEDEIKEITAFYKSPAGVKMIAKMPELMQASMQITQNQMQQIMPKIQALSQEMAAELNTLKRKKPAK